jgi:hypothetical protein
MTNPRLFSLKLASIGSLLTCSLLSVPNSSFAFFIDGQGHFATKGETRIVPEFQKDAGTYQATELSFDLLGEVKANDRASFNLRLGIFDKPENYLGDTAEPRECSPRRSPSGSTTSTNCEGRHQSTTGTGYKDYAPVIREAYAKYAFNYCLLSAGRRSRDVGLGILHNSAKKPFEKDPSVFDGVTCDVNIQKQQDLGFYFGFDKLQETGTYVDNPYDRSVSDPGAETIYNTRSQSFGPNKNSDDLDQFFFGIMLDDLRTKGPGASFAKQVGIYFANILGDGSQTDMKYLDLYTGVYFSKFAIKNEVVFRMGKTAEPSAVSLGGQREGEEGPTRNNMQSIGIAGEVEYTWSRSGASIGPSEFNEGNASRHVSYFTYAYAPGDSDGYYEDGANLPANMSEAKRDNKAQAMAFHKNYKPALLMFNGKSTSNKLAKAGVFSPDRVMNASVYTLGYRYESQETGNFDLRLITARLLEGVPQEVMSYYATTGANSQKPMGYAGNTLGYELDATYAWQYRQEVELGLGLAAALPGKAWDVSVEASPAAQFGLFGSFALKF